jgi:phosphinothricin acetyltransferase
MTNPEIRIRPVTLGDLQAITDIYNHAIRTTTATFDVEEKSLEDRRQWLAEHSERYPVVVAVSGDEIVGWGSLSRYHGRKAYEYSAENAVYVREDMQGKGVGSAILAELVRLGKLLGYHCIIAQVVGGNEISIRLHERQDFVTVGTLVEVGWKFGGWLDVVVMEKLLE